jgi:hypothetical protein
MTYKLLNPLAHALSSFRDTPNAHRIQFLKSYIFTDLVRLLSLSTIERVLFAIFRSAVTYVTEEYFYF